MAFRVRDLMSNVVMQENPCPSTQADCKDRPCPVPSQRPPEMGREMLGILRDQMRGQMRQALLRA